VFLAPGSPDDLSVSVDPDSTDTAINLTVKAKNPLRTGTDLNFHVTKNGRVETRTATLRYPPKQPLASEMVITAENLRKFATDGTEVTGSLVGTDLNLGTLSVTGPTGDSALSIADVGTPTAEKREFKITVKKGLPPDTPVYVTLTTVNDAKAVRDIRTPKPRIDKIDISAENLTKFASDNSTIQGSLSGVDLDLGTLHVTGADGLSIAYEGSGAATKRDFQITLAKAVAAKTKITVQIKIGDTVMSSVEFSTPETPTK
jgi:hypothetical protein